MSEFRPDYGDLAKYPFLNEAGEYIRKSGFDWNELCSPSMKYMIDRAAERIEAALNGDIDTEKGTDEFEVITFLVALLIVKAVGLETVSKKFALAEARRAERFLTCDIKKKPISLSTLFVSKVFNELFGINIGFDQANGLFTVGVSAYLTRASHFHEEQWKLVNRPVKSGLVFLDAIEAVRLIRTELSNMIYSRISSMNLPTMPDTIIAKADMFRRKVLLKFKTTSFTVKSYPPCIEHALEVMGKGENLPHSARLMLATYMLTIGKSIEDIIPFFRNAPDFSEKVTRYQLEHLSGLKGSHTKYSTPSCQKLKNENLCFATSECAGISNPIQFGRQKTT